MPVHFHSLQLSVLITQIGTHTTNHFIHKHTLQMIVVHCGRYAYVLFSNTTRPDKLVQILFDDYRDVFFHFGLFCFTFSLFDIEFSGRHDIIYRNISQILTTSHHFVCVRRIFQSFDFIWPIENAKAARQ